MSSWDDERMTNRRLSAALLLLWAPVSAAVLEIPAAVSGAPLAAAAAASAAVHSASPIVLAPSAFFSFAAPALTAAAPGVPLCVPVGVAPSAAVAVAPAAVAAPVRAFAVEPVVAAAPLAVSARVESAGVLAGTPPSSRDFPRAPALSTDLDALFDGRASSAAADPAPSSRRGAAPALGPARGSRRALGIGLPLAAAVAGAVAPHAALAATHALGQAAYWLANPLAFLFTMPQIHRMLARRSAEISASMTIVGLISALATTLCFGFDGKDLMMYRNLAQAAGFGVLFALQARFSRVSAQPPSKTRALIETVAVALGVVALMLAGGPALMAGAQALPLLGYLLAPLQILAGFGFTYMMYAQLKKMRAEHSSGDSSSGMMWAFLGTKTIWVWSFATMLALATAPAWRTLAVGAAFTGLSWFLSRAVLSRLLHQPWYFMPERVALRRWSISRAGMGDALAFAVLAALILALSLAAWAAFTVLLGVPAASASAFVMYAIYTVQNLVSCVATLETLRLQKRYDGEARARLRF